MPTLRTMQTLHNIQALRAIAVLVVVCFHFAAIEHKYAGDTLSPLWFDYGAAGVDLFFVISGFIMATMTLAMPRCPAHAVVFLARRLARILPMYWLVTLGFLLWLVMRQQLHWDMPTLRHIIASLLLWPVAGPPVLSVGWSLIQEVWFYLVFAVLLGLPRRLFIPSLLVWCLLILLCADADAVRSPLLTVITSPFTLEFLTGVAIGLFWQTRTASPAFARIPGYVLLLLGMAWLIGGVLYWRTLTPDFPGTVHRVMLFAPASAAFVISALLLEQSSCRAPRWLTTIGDASYVIYLTHLLLLAGLGKLWHNWQAVGPLDNALAMGLMLPTCVLAGLVIHLQIEKPLHTLTSRRIRLGAH